MAFVSSIPVSTFLPSSTSPSASSFASRFTTPPCRPCRPRLPQITAVAEPPTTSPSTAHTPGTDPSPQHQSPNSSFDWLNRWYPIGYDINMAPDKPHAVTLLGHDYVLFQDKVSKTYTVFDDLCPHRSVPLSEGRLVDRKNPIDGTHQTILECGYHGWRFDCTGTCVEIPTIPIHGPIREKAHIPRSYPVIVVVGVIFLWPGDDVQMSQTTAPPLPDEFFANDAILFPPFARRFPFDMNTTLENVFDPAHLNWAHHGSSGSRDKTPRNGGVFVQNIDWDTGIVDADMHTDTEKALCLKFRAPFTLEALVPPESSRKVRVSALFWAVPVRPDETLLYNMVAVISAPWFMKPLFRFLTPWKRCVSGMAITDSDSPMLRRQHELLRKRKSDPSLSTWKHEYGLAHVEWDGGLIAMRKVLDRVSESLPEDWKRKWAELGEPTRVDRRVVMDRYQSHTVDCVACMKQLKRSRRVKVAMWIVLALVGVVGVSNALVSLALRANRAGGPGSTALLRMVAAGAAVVGLMAMWMLRSAMYREEVLTYTERPYEMARSD